jgi:hypothetical protein
MKRLSDSDQAFLVLGLTCLVIIAFAIYVQLVS